MNYLEAQVGVKLTNDQTNILFTKFSSYIYPLSRKTLNCRQISLLFKSVNNVLLSGSIRWMIAEKGYVFDGLLGPSGLSKSLLYRVIECSSFNVLCAKVCLEITDAQKEMSWSEILHHNQENQYIVRYKSLSVSHLHLISTSLALLMPLFPISLENAIEAYFDQPFRPEIFKKLAKGLLYATESFHLKGLSHCDIKPGNVMVNFILSIIILYLVKC